MQFNEKKCQEINFGRRVPIFHYKLGASCLEWAKQHTLNTDCVSRHRFSKMKISTAHYLQPVMRQTAGDSHHLGSCQRRANLNIHQQKLLPHKFPATNYWWDAQRQRPVIIKQQNAVKTCNSDSKMVKTRGLPVNMLVAVEVYFNYDE